VAAQNPQARGLALRLDTFGGDLEIKALAEPDQSDGSRPEFRHA